MSDQDTSSQAGVAVYLRVSGENQRRRGTIETQRPDLDRYLAAYNLKPYGWYEDEAVSGHWVPFPERPQGKRLLADAQAGHLGLVLVWRLDRFGRNAVEILKAVEELEQAGARLVSLKEQFDTRTAAGRLMLGILASVAEFEWESIMERTVAGVERRLDGGGWMGGPVPYGYKAEGTKQDAKLVIDEEPLGIPDYPLLTAAGVVRLIYSLLLDERQSTIEIADKLHQMGVPTSYQRRGRTYHRDGQVGPEQHIWRANAVRNILRNPVYKGEYTFGRRSLHHAGREVVTCDVPALVSVETWDAAAAQLEKNLLFSPRNATYDYLLKGLMKCGLCGHLYIGDAGESGPKYVCYAHRRPHILWGSKALADERRCRDSLPLKAGRAEALVWASVEHDCRNPGPTLARLQERLTGQADASADIRAKLAEKQQEQAEKQGERDSVVALFRKGRIDERDLDRQLDDIAREELEISADVAKLTDKLAAADKVSQRIAGAAALLQRLRDKLDAGPPTPADKREFIETLIDEIVVRPELDEATGRMRAVLDIFSCADLAAEVGVADNTLMHGHIRGRGLRSSGRAWAGGRG
jgi:site-specific DNA recombinase